MPRCMTGSIRDGTTGSRDNHCHCRAQTSCSARYRFYAKRGRFRLLPAALFDVYKTFYGFRRVQRSLLPILSPTASFTTAFVDRVSHTGLITEHIPTGVSQCLIQGGSEKFDVTRRPRIILSVNLRRRFGSSLHTFQPNFVKIALYTRL